MSASDALAAVAPGPAAAVASCHLVFRSELDSRDFRIHERRTKSVDEPLRRPTLAPPTDTSQAWTLPVEVLHCGRARGRGATAADAAAELLHTGRISTQSGLFNKAGEMLLLLSISCNTRLACRRVSSSFSLSAATQGRSSAASLRGEEARQSFW